MWTRRLLKENARIAFHRNFGSCVAVSALAALLSGGIAIGNSGTGMGTNETVYGDSNTFNHLLNQIPTRFLMLFLMVLIVSMIIALVFTVLVSNVVEVGRCRYYLENREHKTPISQMFHGFQGGRYSGNVWIMFWRSFYIFAWMLVFVIPGILKSYSYLLVPYILAENPQLSRKRVLKLSELMMDGHKWEAFKLQWSFLGWMFLGAISNGIVTIFYVNPYIHATMAEFYSAIKAEAQMKGIVMPIELPGVADDEERIV